MQTNRINLPCIEKAKNGEDDSLTRLLVQHWRPLFRSVHSTKLYPVEAVTGVEKLMKLAGEAWKQNVDKHTPYPPPFAALERITTSQTSTSRQALPGRLWESIIMHMRVVRLQTNVARQKRGRRLVGSEHTVAQKAEEKTKWDEMRAKPPPPLVPELDLAARSLLPLHHAYDLITHDGETVDGKPDWGRDPTSTRYKRALFEIERSYYLTTFSNASQNIIRHIERLGELGLQCILPQRADVGCVMFKKTADDNENVLIRNSFGHNNYWSAEDGTLVGDYRIYMWNIDKSKTLTYAAFTSFPELLDYELRLRIILTLLITGVLYDEEEIVKVRQQYKEDVARSAREAAEEKKMEKDKAKEDADTQAKQHKAKVDAEMKAKHRERLAQSGKDEKRDELEADEKGNDEKYAKGKKDDSDRKG